MHETLSNQSKCAAFTVQVQNQKHKSKIVENKNLYVKQMLSYAGWKGRCQRSEIADFSK